MSAVLRSVIRGRMNKSVQLLRKASACTAIVRDAITRYSAFDDQNDASACFVSAIAKSSLSGIDSRRKRQFSSSITTTTTTTNQRQKQQRQEKRNCSYSTTTTKTTVDDDDDDGDMSKREQEFSQKANEYLENLCERIEEWADSEPEASDVECDYSDGVLTVKLGKGRGTYVLNKQGPNRQIWWSSPISGPFRFEDDGRGNWADARAGEDDDNDLGERKRLNLEQKLLKEWSEIFPRHAKLVL